MTEHHEALADSFDQPRDPDWYKRAVFYEVLVRGFQDSAGDGTGDLRGLTSRLDYLAWRERPLGVNEWRPQTWRETLASPIDEI